VGLHFICEVGKIAAVNVMVLTRELRVSMEPIAWDLRNITKKLGTKASAIICATDRFR
jgi:hypothetical protein